VRSTISSLWEVNDEATANLMTEFYTHMQRDRSHVDLAQSLRFAQLKLRSGEIRPSSGGTFKHPRFWAAFFLSGVPQMSLKQ
jgi:CHAT domain-containing protein